VDDMAAACIHVMGLPRNEFLVVEPDPMCSYINVGTGIDITIAQLVRLMAKTVVFEGELVFDTNKPDGTMHNLTDIGRLKSLGVDL